MSLTIPQTDWLADFDANVIAFRAAIEASMEADNDPTSVTLEAAQDLADELRARFSFLATNLGYGLYPDYNSHAYNGRAVQFVLPGPLAYPSGVYPSIQALPVPRKAPPNQSNGPIRAYGLPVLTRVNDTY